MQMTLETRKLWEAVEAEGIIKEGTTQVGMTFPESFLSGLRNALKAGLTCEQLVAFMSIITGLHEISKGFGDDELVKRTAYLVEVMKGDLEFLEKQREIIKRSAEIRDLEKEIQEKQPN